MKRSVLVVVVLVALVLGACVGGDDVAESFQEIASGLGGDQTTESPSTAPDEVESVVVDEEAASRVTAQAVVATVDLGRDIIFTADMTVAVEDVPGAGTEATRIVNGLGGYLFAQQSVGSPEPRSVLTFKVPPENFQEALSKLGAIGEIRSQNVSANDVTDAIVDLESRIATAATSVARLRALLEEATDIETIVELENELLTRETQLETLRGQHRTLQDQVALASVSVSLTEATTMPAVALVVTAYGAHDGGLSCPGADGLVVDQGTATTVCYEIINVGDTWLAEFELRDPVLDIEFADLITVFGDPTLAIEPGESLIVAAEVVPERSLRTQTTVTAQPVDEAGAPVLGRPASTTVTTYIDAVDPGGIATFGEGLEASWDALLKLFQMLALLLGALIPFLWIPAAVGFIWWWRKSRPEKA
ncbi:MAG: DUF4349 domain-containing protein [Acidimicrobiia bacterium]